MLCLGAARVQREPADEASVQMPQGLPRPLHLQLHLMQWSRMCACRHTLGGEGAVQVAPGTPGASNRKQLHRMDGAGGKMCTGCESNLIIRSPMQHLRMHAVYLLCGLGTRPIRNRSLPHQATDRKVTHHTCICPFAHGHLDLCVPHFFCSGCMKANAALQHSSAAAGSYMQGCLAPQRPKRHEISPLLFCV